MSAAAWAACAALAVASTVGALAAAGAGLAGTEPQRMGPARPALAGPPVPAVFPVCDAARDARARYGWPLRPFDRPHPIRGTFGDPRTVERSGQSVDGGGSVGSFTFHNGVDIVADDGTAVYPVVSGIAVVKHRYEVSVHAAGNRIFQYWHILPLVHTGQLVTAGQTVLGTIKPRARHVHFGEIDGTRVVNPLAPGHLGPYSDVQQPSVRELLARSAQGEPLSLARLEGRVALIADASDAQPAPFRGPWFGMPVMPARVRWRLLRADGSVVKPWRTALDLRLHEPSPTRFWDTYAPGTYQNFPVLQDRFHFGEPGRYLVRLTHFLLDTRTLANGGYVVHVEAGDICGNSRDLREQVTIQNLGVGL